MPSVDQQPALRRVSNTTSVEDILAAVHEDGGVIIQQFLTQDQVNRFNADIDPAMNALKSGSTHADAEVAGFHGSNTKRMTNLVTRSKTFREEILDKDFVHAIAEKVFLEESGSYWMSSAEIIEIGPGNKAQSLHRDLENDYPFIGMGTKGPEVMLNFLIALTDFTEENGATRVIPGSNKWPDFTDRGTPEMTIPAEMKAGDVLLITCKVVHGGGYNQTLDFYRRCVSFAFRPGFLTPEEAYPFLVDIKLVKQLSKRAQGMLGFRSQYPRGSPGLWQSDNQEIAGLLGL